MPGAVGVISMILPVMKMKHRLITCFVILIFTGLCFSITAYGTSTNAAFHPYSDHPGKNTSGAKTLKYKARKYMRNGQVYKAIDSYSQYLSENPDDIKSTFILAGLYRNVRDYENAVDLYDKVISEKPEKYKLAWYYSGIVLMNLEKYDLAIDRFAVFRKKYRHEKKNTNYRKLASVYIQGAEQAKMPVSDSVGIVVEHLNSSINKDHIEFAPFPVDENHIIYGALYENTAGSSDQTGGLRKIYTAEKNHGTWQSTGMFAEPVNKYLSNAGNAVITEDGKRLYFTRCRTNWKKQEICEIYLSNNVDGTWQEPVKLDYPVNDENYTSSQPAVVTDPRKGQDILYFVSDRPGGRGGTDIWYTTYDKRQGAYKEPRNTGSKINSPGNESTPFYDAGTGILYFSSNGHPGFGGYDIYRSAGNQRRWAEIEHLPRPLNSSFDDLYYARFRDKNEGFFTSNRPGSDTLNNGYCCDDIYSFVYRECTFILSIGRVYGSPNHDIIDLLNDKFNLGLTYSDEKKYLEDTPVELYLKDKDNGRELFMFSARTDGDGFYRFNIKENNEYVIRVKNYGFFDKRFEVNTKGMDCNDTLFLKETGITYIPDVPIRFSVYYEHDKYRLTDAARTTIDTSLIDVFELFPNAVIEIGSHTDSTGTFDYNIRLSQRRSESVVKYLISKGISSERLSARGYGESMPIAPNTNPDGSDNPEGRQLNRRTEIRIIGELNKFYEDDEEE